ncbi:PIG-L family deacetylase [Frankia sp. AgB1.9]|uniref:PIG-L deacetylase family protein n=1 Tax=unclassified Frankia TaxID=2632575 RepID=UPI001933C817|nr:MULTISPECIES: PIG-L family deacetylase [unclassified Frankia]MBL7492669.1 PIG-L family deacetylase [Frankia sp. AgW1.1]MBL7549213.1 PIG-L family deacetylase [Frankia sp. AgB1.9]MBL7619430.1 PIG-L family deacetylase [Frankia sp. AgB1.8]
MATVVSFHAHPDDEALWTGGTLALLAAAGHRVIIVVATDGDMGDGPAAGARLAELAASATVLGVARVEYLGYADSGHGPLLYPDPADRRRFARVDLDEAAGKLAALLRAEAAEVLISYDAQGGYGHRDHVRVHQVGARAATLAGGVRVLEATLPREPVERAMRLGRLGASLRPARPRGAASGRQPVGPPASEPDPAYSPNPPMFTPRREIAYRVDVRRHARAKRASLAVHASQLTGRSAPARLRRAAVQLPVPLFALLGGREYFNDPAATGAAFLDVFPPVDPASPRGG